MDRPLCKCHSEPMLRDGWHRGKQKWQCGIKERGRQARLYSSPEHAARKLEEMRRRWCSGGSDKSKAVYAERKARGVCTRCEGPLLSEAFCWDCLNAMEARRALR